MQSARSFARSLPNWFCIAPGLRVARQVVGRIEPRQLVLDEYMGERLYVATVAQRDGEHVNLVRQLFVLIGERRAAFTAKAAPHALRGHVVRRLNSRETKC